MAGAKFCLQQEIDSEAANSGENQNDFDKQEKIAIDKEIEKMLTQKVIEHTVKENNEVVSKIFTREKKEKGAVRVILNLKKLNSQLQTEKFKMEGIKSALDLITPNCYMGSIDLVSAYYSVPVHEKYRKYLKFFYEGQLYQFTCLPNGFCQAPWVFTKLLKPVYATLHSMGHLSTYYLDDSLLIGKSITECNNNIKDTVELLDSLGFFVHKDKSSFEPKQVIEYLGIIIDSRNMNIELTNRRKDKIIQECLRVKSVRRVTIRELSVLIGAMVASFLVIPFGKVFYRELEKEKTKGLRTHKGNWEKKITLSCRAIEDIDWWLENVHTKTPINRGKPDLLYTTDASNVGWGGIYLDQVVSGLWSETEKEEHINVKEMLAVKFALQIFAKEIKNKHIRLRVDNMVTLHVINNMGTCKNDELNLIAKQIWIFAYERGLWLSTEYVASEDNQADAPSREPSINMDAEWMLNTSAFQKATKELGFYPTIDLFATRHNCQLKKFVSFKPDPEAYRVDAFALNWEGLQLYAFPPFNVLTRVLKKIRTDRATGMVVMPLWKAQPFYPMAMSMLIGSPVIFSPRSNLLVMPNEPSKIHKMGHKLRLLVGIFSGKD